MTCFGYHDNYVFHLYSSFSLLHGKHLIQVFNKETSVCAINELEILRNSLLYQFGSLFSLYTVQTSRYKLSCRK